ncbi:serine/threonine-protein kinase 35-like [Haliotis cracherodii]|uniref:serine/threonine-protein kinase 35-like n=1 Tax=Haliotis cracherodii TaxID=6455 RepID=UPI0039E78620
MSDVPLSPGTGLGNYHVVRAVGRGEFGTLYESRRGRGSFTLRGKKVEEQWAVDNEISMMNGLPQHTHVTTFLDSVAHGNTIYFVLEDCNIGTLNDFLIKEKPPEQFLQSLMFDMAKGIFHLHRNKIVHRDLNPNNVLLSAGNHRPICKIFNLSLAQYGNCHNQLDSVPNVLDISTHADLHLFLTTRCSDKFWPPEIKDPGDSFRFASDIFSLGLVFLSMVSLRVKHDKYLSKDIIYPPTVKRSSGVTPLFLCSLQDVKEVVASIVNSAAVQDLVCGMLHPTHGKRPQAGQLVAAMETFVAPDRSIPIGFIVLLSLAVLLIVVIVTWKLTFDY